MSGLLSGLLFCQALSYESKMQRWVHDLVSQGASSCAYVRLRIFKDFSLDWSGEKQILAASVAASHNDS